MYKIVAFSVKNCVRNRVVNGVTSAKVDKLKNLCYRFPNLKISDGFQNEQALLSVPVLPPLNNRRNYFTCSLFKNDLFGSCLKCGFSSEASVVDSKPTESAAPITTDQEIEKLNVLFPTPKNTLHNCFASVSQQLKRGELKLEPTFKKIKQGKTYVWQCTYFLRWPEDVKFTHTSASKVSASSRTALAALSYLKKNGRIGKDGLPIVYDKAEVRNLREAYPALKLEEETVDKLETVSMIYRNNFVPLLVDSVRDEGSAEMRSREWVKEGDNLERNRARQRYQNLDLYLAREPVKLPISDYK